MKKIILILLCLILTGPTFAAIGEASDCCTTINSIMDESAEEYRKMSQTIMQEYIKEPDTVGIEDCLAAINSVNLGFSFSLPSLDDLLAAACKFAKGQIKSKLQEAASVVKNQYSFGAYGVGANGDVNVGTDGNSDIDFEVKDTSQEIVDSIWRSIQ